MGDRIALYARSLAKDGARRAEVRAICSEPLIDYSGASWDEWVTLVLLADSLSEFGSTVATPSETREHNAQPTTGPGKP